MNLTRRMWLGTAAAAAASTAAASAAIMPGSMPSTLDVRRRSLHDYAPALDALRSYALSELRAVGMPGMTLGVVDADGFTALMTFGWADLDRKVPVSTNHLFQIGSISKAFAALTLFHLSDAGRIDLGAPLARYLPDAALPDEPITIAQVLSHMAGLPEDAPLFPRVAGGRLWTGFMPGSHFSYSNTGYELLGILISRITGRPHPDVIRDVVLTPLGMTATRAVIANEDRAGYAVGYIPFYQERPALTQAPLTEGPWTDEDFASGSIASTAEQMANYLRFLLKLGSGAGAPVLASGSARIFATPVIEAPIFGPKARYGNGLATVLLGGKPCLHHTGGMICYTSSFHADPAAGVACFASVNGSNGDYRPRKTTGLAVELMRAVRAGTKPPAAPDPVSDRAIAKPQDYEGRFVSMSGDALEIVSRNGRLVLQGSGATGRLQQAGKDTLMTDHPRWVRHLLTAVRENGRIEALWWADRLFGRNAARAQLPAPAELQALAGTYLNRDPWVGQADVFARGNRLILEGGGTLVKADDDQWKLQETNNPERFVFDGALNGRATRLNISGSDLLRIF